MPPAICAHLFSLPQLGSKAAHLARPFRKFDNDPSALQKLENKQKYVCAQALIRLAHDPEDFWGSGSFLWRSACFDAGIIWLSDKSRRRLARE